MSSPESSPSSAPEQTGVERLTELDQQLSTIVPSSLEEAQEFVTTMQEIANTITPNENGIPTMAGEEVPEDVATSFRNRAELGLGNWRLDAAGQHDAQVVMGARTRDDLSSTQQDELDRIGQRDPSLSEEDRLMTLKVRETQRLTLSREIATVAADSTPEPATPGGDPHDKDADVIPINRGSGTPASRAGSRRRATRPAGPAKSASGATSSVTPPPAPVSPPTPPSTSHTPPTPPAPRVATAAELTRFFGTADTGSTPPHAPLAPGSRPVATAAELTRFFGTTEADPAAANAALLNEKQGNMQISLERLATAKTAMESGVGRRNRRGRETELNDAVREVGDLISNDPELTPDQRMELKFMAMERVSEIQVENAEIPGRFARTMQRVGNSRVMQFVKNHKPLVYGAVAAATVVGAAITVATGGAALPAVAAAVGFGVAKGAGIGAVVGAGMGRVGARVTRQFEHTAEATQNRNEQQLAGFVPQVGETYYNYLQRVNNAQVSQAGEMYNANTVNRRRAIGRGVLNGAISGAVMGGAMAGAHAFHVSGVEHATTTNVQLTPEQIHNQLQTAIDLDPSKINQIPGLEHFDASHMGELSQQAGLGPQHNLWTDVHQFAGNNATTESMLLDDKGMAALNNAGFHVPVHGGVHLEGNHFVATTDHWRFGDVQAPEGGSYVIGPDGHIHAFTGTLNNGQQAALIQLLHEPGTSSLMNHDQLVTTLATHVKASALHTTHTTTGVVPNAIDNSLETTLLNPTSAAADVVAAGVGAVAAVAPERARRGQATPPVQPTRSPQDVRANVGEVIGANQVLRDYDQRMSAIDLMALDPINQRNTVVDQVREVAIANGAAIDQLRGGDWSDLADQMAQRTKLDKSTILQLLQIRS